MWAQGCGPSRLLWLRPRLLSTRTRPPSPASTAASLGSSAPATSPSSSSAVGAFYVDHQQIRVEIRLTPAGALPGGELEFSVPAPSMDLRSTARDRQRLGLDLVLLVSWVMGCQVPAASTTTDFDDDLLATAHGQ